MDETIHARRDPFTIAKNRKPTHIGDTADETTETLQCNRFQYFNCNRTHTCADNSHLQLN